METMIEYDCYTTTRENIPNEATLVLIVDQIQGISSPGFLDLFDVFLKSHLWNSKHHVIHSKWMDTHFALGLNDNILDQRLILLEIHVINISQCHSKESSAEIMNCGGRYSHGQCHRGHAQNFEQLLPMPIFQSL